jgi:multicomponent Na+:H+ antiporter subunit D
MQSELKRMLAYSSVSQFGLVVAAFALATPDSILGGVIHLVGHGLMKGGLLATAAILAATYGARTVEDYARLGYRSPVTAAVLGVLGVALVGVPPSIGFLGKWYVAVGAVRAEAWFVAVVVFLSTLLTLAYIARLLERLYFADPEASPAPPPEPSGAVTDGGSADDERTASDIDEDVDAPDIDVDTRAPEDVSPGMIAVVVLTAIAVVALGFSTAGFETLLDPFIGGALS